MLVAILDHTVVGPTAARLGVTFRDRIIDQNSRLEVVLPLLEQSHRCTSIDNRRVILLLNRRTQVQCCQIFQPFWVFALEFDFERGPIVLEERRVGIAHMGETQGLQVVLDCVSDKNAVAEVRHDVVLDFFQRGRCLQPF